MLPLLEGKPLSELLHDEQLTLEEILIVLVRAMDRVAAAHALGVLHQNLKPSNIRVRMSMSGRYDDPRVLDLTDTQQGRGLDSLPYTSLEQLEGLADLDARVDVYAMGVILYEAICGVLPHHAESAASLALELRHMPPVHLGLRRPDLPAELAAVVMRALASEREQRYGTMRELINATLPFVPTSATLTVRERLQASARDPRVRRERVSDEDLIHAPSSARLAAPRVPAELLSAAEPTEAQASLAPHRTSLRARMLGALGALSVTAAALGGARLVSWSHTDSASHASTPIKNRAPVRVPNDKRVGSPVVEPLIVQDAGLISPAQAAQPRGATTITTLANEADASWPRHDRNTSPASVPISPTHTPRQ
ncbi:MAG: hypothetical protein RLZZ450_7038 [Pseudomonadota bacterium]